MKLLSFFLASLAILVPLTATPVFGQEDVHDTTNNIEVPPALKNLYATIQDHNERNHLSDQDERNLLFGDALYGNIDAFGNINDKDKEKNLGERCGRRNPCKSGLDCVAPSGRAGWRICLPTTCIQEAANEFNQPQPATGTTPFEDYVGNIFQGAGLSRNLFTNDNAEGLNEIVNQTTVKLGADVMENNNYKHYIKDDVVEALQISLVQEDARNPMAPLHDKVQECLRPFLGDVTQTTTTANNGGRNLQDFEEGCFMYNGFFVEGSAVLQFLYGWGTFSNENGTQFVSQDICFGAGPTVGKLIAAFWLNMPNPLLVHN